MRKSHQTGPHNVYTQSNGAHKSVRASVPHARATSNLRTRKSTDAPKRWQNPQNRHTRVPKHHTQAAIHISAVGITCKRVACRTKAQRGRCRGPPPQVSRPLTCGDYSRSARNCGPAQLQTNMLHTNKPASRAQCPPHDEKMPMPASCRAKRAGPPTRSSGRGSGGW